MTLRRTNWLIALLVILVAAGCGQESDTGKEGGIGSVSPGEGPDPPPRLGRVVIDDMDRPLDR